MESPTGMLSAGEKLSTRTTFGQPMPKNVLEMQNKPHPAKKTKQRSGDHFFSFTGVRARLQVKITSDTDSEHMVVEEVEEIPEEVDDETFEVPDEQGTTLNPTDSAMTAEPGGNKQTGSSKDVTQEPKMEPPQTQDTATIPGQVTETGNLQQETDENVPLEELATQETQNNSSKDVRPCIPSGKA